MTEAVLVDIEKTDGKQFREILKDLQREVTLAEISKILSTTIKEDEESKLITFLVMLLTFTDEDQQNIAFKSESCRGKSYIPLEIIHYFPDEIVIKSAYCSPTAFFHEKGEWDDEEKTVNVDLRQKILIFLDQPHDMLLQRLRPLLSHDSRKLAYRITDRKQKSGYRTKTTIIHGFPTVVFCTAKVSIGDQERTRMFLLSPGASQNKLAESIKLLAKRLGNRDAFKEELEANPKRKWLRDRVDNIKNADIQNIILPNAKEICERFLVYRENLIPRHQRDFPRLIALIKAHALLNLYQREIVNKGKTIIANETDVQAGFQLYEEVVAPQELGVSPEVLEIYEKAFKPNFPYNEALMKYEGLTRRDLLSCYHAEFHRTLSSKRLSNEIIPALEAAGLIIEDRNPENRSQKMIFPTHLKKSDNTHPLTVGNTPDSYVKGLEGDPFYPMSKGVSYVKKKTHSKPPNEPLDPLRKVREFTSGKSAKK